MNENSIKKIPYPNKNELLVLNEIILKLNETNNIKQTSKWAEKKGYQTRAEKPFSATTIKRLILTEKQYKGGLGNLLNGLYVRNMYEVVDKKKKMKLEKYWIKIKVPSPIKMGLINEKALEEVRKKLIEKTKTHNYPTKLNTYLLSGLLEHSECGGKMYGHKQKNGNPRYRCRKCRHSVNLKEYENHIFKFLDSILFSTEGMNNLINQYSNQIKGSSSKRTLKESLKNIRCSIPKLKKAIKGLYIKFGTDDKFKKDKFQFQIEKKRKKYL
ncbi:zinc ribbon domain-containing protein [Candidatus Margulisiibacteriota bacterium]